MLKKFLLKRLFSKTNEIKDFEFISIFSSLSSNRFDSNVRVAKHASVTKSKIGAYTSIGGRTQITHTNIGKFCAISWNCTINAVKHPLENLTISAFPYVPEIGGFVSKRTQAYQYVQIGNDVWIGANVVIMPGISIGDGAVIGAGSVVTKDVLPYRIVCGSPAKTIKKRFDDRTIDKLLDIKWWYWSDEILKNNIGLFNKKITHEVLDQISNIHNTVS
jgi:acetyltransferase-like isoleucine patch superfamily enzyme